MRLECPKCGLDLAVDDAAGRMAISLCRSCGSAWICQRQADAEGNETTQAFPLPRRVRFEQRDDGFTISASIFQPAAVLILMFVIINAGLSVKAALDGSWITFAASLLGMVVGVGMCLEWVLGRFRFAVHGDTASLDQGHPLFHRTKEFSWADVASADEGTARLLGMHRIVLEMSDGRKVNLGDALPDDRRQAVMRLLRHMLERRG